MIIPGKFYKVKASKTYRGDKLPPVSLVSDW